MAKKTAGKTAFASLNPDDMLQGGLPTDFRGTITEAAYVEWDYEGKSDKPVLAARLTIQPADGEDVNDGKPIVQHWSAGNLKDWAPGDEDGDRVDEGPYAVRVGKRDQMNNNTNFAHLMQTILESGTAAKGKPFTAKNLDANITCLVGLDAHWDRVPQKKRAGMVDRLADDDDAGDEEQDEKPQRKSGGRDILVVTEVFGYDPDGASDAKPAKKKTKPVEEDDEEEQDEDEEEEKPVKKATKKPAKPADDEDEEEAEDEDEESEEDPFDAELAKKIAKEITKAGGSLKKNKLSTLMLKAYASAKPKDKSKAVERSTEEEFLSDGARPWSYDEDTGVLTIDE